MANEVLRITAAAFKANCLRPMEEVARRRVSVVITKHGNPIAKLVPAASEAIDPFGCMAGTVTIRGDIVGPTEAEWTKGI